MPTTDVPVVPRDPCPGHVLEQSTLSRHRPPPSLTPPQSESCVSWVISTPVRVDLGEGPTLLREECKHYEVSQGRN